MQFTTSAVSLHCSSGFLHHSYTVRNVPILPADPHTTATTVAVFIFSHQVFALTIDA